MENRFEHIDELIAMVITGEATEDKIRLVEEWVAISDENAAAFETSKKLFDQSSSLKVTYSVDTDKAWLKVKQHVGENISGNKIIFFNTLSRHPIFRIAAILAIIAGLSATAYFLLNSKLEINDKVISTAGGITKEFLPDGSSVILNKKSSISYSTEGYGRKRTIHLKGEAFFNVKHDDKSAFTVETEGLLIEDVGTSFNVKANPDSKTVIVTVETGEVKLYTPDQKDILLVAGENASYNTATGKFLKSINQDKNASAYKDKIFIFDNTELEVIVKLLNDIYESKIIIGNAELNQCRLSATFNNESLELMIDVIAETLQLEVIKTESEIRLNGNGCK